MPLADLRHRSDRNPRRPTTTRVAADWATALSDLDAGDQRTEQLPNIALKPEQAAPLQRSSAFVGCVRSNAKAPELYAAAPQIGHPAQLCLHGDSHHNGDWAGKPA